LKQNPEISFVIPSYRSRTTIESTVASILSQKAASPCELIIVESGGDEEAAGLTQLFPAVTILNSKGRLYPGAARNAGARLGSGTFLAFVDADVTLPPAWLEALLAKMSAAPLIEAIAAPVANANPEELPSRILHWVEFSEYLPGQLSGFRPALSSSNLLLRRETFWKAAGFAEHLAMGEDLLFSQKLPNGLYLETSLAVLHRHRSDWRLVCAHLRQLGYWSGLHRRHHKSSGDWLRHVPILSFGLPGLRSLRILRRVIRSDWRSGLRAVGRTPWIVTALLYWASGFRQGLTGRARIPS
jgi:glycosyltransferase involved in cell wall biosynthesis